MIREEHSGVSPTDASNGSMVMSKEKVKKKAEKSLKEKRQEKREKRQQRA